MPAIRHLSVLALLFGLPFLAFGERIGAHFGPELPLPRESANDDGPRAA